jgi:phospholipid/cholesterol/gamma-HCH transport system permease protein
MIFLLGVVFAYLLGVQAQKFGANIFVVDGVTAAVLRELSPVIVAILVAGRTGAAITAQLGTMKVNEEIDALSVLGLSPIAVLVVPRMLALILALPLLVFVGDVAGLLGGMLVAKSQLGLEFSQFWARLDNVVQIKTVLVGMGKAPVFAVFIGLIACRMGMTVARDARSVGLHTTSTVVQSIVAVIMLNAIFAVAFTELGI